MQGVQALDTAIAASLIRWWRDAGVDVLVDDAPRQWLKVADPLSAGKGVAERCEAGRGFDSLREAPLPGRFATVSLPTRDGDRGKLPPTLPELLAWMRESPDVPEAAWGRTRILPAGDPTSGLMILSDMPERGDAEAGRLLAGEVGDLFDKMLAAIGRSRETVWLAPIATVRSIGRVPVDCALRLTEIARHQVALVAPKRLLIMGETPNRALIGEDWQTRRGALHSINLDGVEVEAVATFHPRLLLERPAAKKQAWADLQLLMKGL